MKLNQILFYLYFINIISIFYFKQIELNNKNKLFYLIIKLNHTKSSFNNV